MSTILDVAPNAPAYAVDRRALIPQAWLATETEEQFHLYNPALTRFVAVASLRIALTPVGTGRSTGALRSAP